MSLSTINKSLSKLSSRVSKFKSNALGRGTTVEDGVAAVPIGVATGVFIEILNKKIASSIVRQGVKNVLLNTATAVMYGNTAIVTLSARRDSIFITKWHKDPSLLSATSADLAGVYNYGATIKRGPLKDIPSMAHLEAGNYVNDAVFEFNALFQGKCIATII